MCLAFICMKTIVTGGSGYLGTHVRKFFDADDFSRRSSRSVTNMQDVREIGEYDLVIHLAAYLDKSPDAADDVFLTNVDGTVNILNHVKEGATFVFASTKDVYGRFADNFQLVPESCQTLYAGQSALEWSKLIAERYVEFYANKNNFRSCIFRLSNVYAPKSEGNYPGFVGGFVDDINFGERMRLPGGGSPIRDFLHVDDLSEACKAFHESIIRHGLFNLGGGQSNAVSIRELVETMEQVSGLQAVVDKENPLPAPTPNRYISDLSLVRQELDWKPRTSLKEGLATLFNK